MTITNMIVFAITTVIFASVALSSESEISSIPGDNSKYVDGESQYIWIPDGDGVPHLQDLNASLDSTVLNARNGVNNQYWLFTRKNRDNHQFLRHGDNISIFSSNFQPDLPTKIIIHGWNSNGYSAINLMITSAFLDTQDCNVIVLDWRDLANSNYFSASYGAPVVGQALGNFLIWLHYATGMNWNQLHIVGFSLGAHVAGSAGRTCDGRPIRVTGLDPALPLWGKSKDAINTKAGQFVEIIHTDAGILGISNNIGHVDFYPNGGDSPQPGCWFSVCSHIRSYELFASSVQTDHFLGNQCANLSQARNIQCNGSHFKMGNGILSKRGNGIYGLRTGSSWPY